MRSAPRALVVKPEALNSVAGRAVETFLLTNHL